MPILPPIAGVAPYDTVDSVLNVARVRINDAIVSIGGDILQDTQPFTQVMTNIAWRKLQRFLSNLGGSRQKCEAIIPNLPVVGNIDPATQTYISYTQYFDGQNYWPLIFLPQAASGYPILMQPLKLWERPTGFNCDWWPMTMSLDGLYSYAKLGRNSQWEYRQETIFLPGATIPMDIRIRYLAFQSDFLTVGSVMWYQQPVPMVDCMDAFSYFIAAEAAAPRADLDAATFTSAGEQAARLIFNREVQAKQRTTCTRRPYGRRTAYAGYDFYA